MPRGLAWEAGRFSERRASSDNQVLTTLDAKRRIEGKGRKMGHSLYRRGGRCDVHSMQQGRIGRRPAVEKDTKENWKLC